MSWRNNLRDVEPYVAGEQPKMSNLIKLNTNENPYEPGEKAKEAIQSFDPFKLRLYPDADASKLKHLIAEYHGLEDDQVFLGNGSDEVLALTFLTCFNGQNPILFPDITYSFYPVYCELFNIDYKTVALDDAFKIKKEDYFNKNGGIIFPNPNAPTGELMSVDDIEDIIKHNSESVVVIDEAYIDFGGETVIPLLKKYDNLLVIHTFSKFRSLAGSRLGVALGNKELVSHLYDVKNSFNSYPIDALAQVIGEASIKDSEVIKEHAKKIIATRERTKKALKEMGFTMTDSYSNFIFIHHDDYDAEHIFKELRKKHIIVRYFNAPRINQYLRVTIGNDEEMDAFLDAVKEIIQAS